MYWKIQPNLNQNSSVIFFFFELVSIVRNFIWKNVYIEENRYLGQKWEKGEVALADIEKYYKGRIK